MTVFPVLDLDFVVDLDLGFVPVADLLLRLETTLYWVVPVRWGWVFRYLPMAL